MSQFSLMGHDADGAFALPDFLRSACSFEMGDIGALSLEYHANGINSGRLFDNVEVALLLDNVEVPNGRWIIRGSSGDENPEASNQILKFAGRSNHVILDTTLVLGTTPETPPVLSYKDKTPGFILNELFTQAQGRGAMTGFTWSFSSTLTTDAEAWPEVMTIDYKPGTKYIEILRGLVDKGLLEFRISGKAIEVYNLDSMSSDRTLSNPAVVLRSGLDFSDAPFQRSVDDFASDVVVEGDNASFQLRSDAVVTHPYGRQEVYIQQSGTSDEGTLIVIGDAELEKRRDPKVEKTRKIVITPETKFRPLIDYEVGDYIYQVSNDVGERIRVVMISVELGQDGQVSGSIVLNDKFVEQEIRTARKIAGILNGSSSSPNGPPTGSYIDYTIPNAPTITSVTSASYSLNDGTPFAVVTTTITPPPLNTDNSLCTDVAWHNVRWRYVDADLPPNPGPWNIIQGDGDPAVTFSHVRAGASIEIEAAVIDGSSHISSWSLATSHTTALDATTPPVPTGITVTQKFGTITINWDGTVTGGTFPTDFSHVEFHRKAGSSMSSTIPAGAATLIGTSIKKDSITMSELTANQTYYFRIVAVDSSGNRSLGSAEVNMMASLLVRAEISSGSITYNEIAYKDNGNVISDGSFESSQYRSLRSGQQVGWAASSGALSNHGSWHMFCTGDGTTTKFQTIAGETVVVAGQKLYWRMYVRANAASNGTLSLELQWKDQAAATREELFPLVVAKTDTWIQLEGVITVAVGDVHITRVRLHSQSQTAGIYRIDAVEMREIIQTALIDDAAITTAKIQDLAVNTAKVNNLSAAKLDAGTITSDKISLGVMQNNLVRNPGFEDNVASSYEELDEIEMVDVVGGWTSTSIEGEATSKAYLLVRSAVSRSGRCTLAVAKTAAKQGAYAESSEFAVRDGATYVTGAHFAKESTSNDPNYSIRLVFWTGAVWTEDAGVGGTLTSTTWTDVKDSVVAPAGSAKAKLRIYNFQGDAAATLLYAEDAFCLEQGIGGMSITPTSIRMYNQDGTETVSMDGSQSTIQAGTFKTSIDGNRVRIDTDEEEDGVVSFYSGSPLEVKPGELRSGETPWVRRVSAYARTSNVATIETSITGDPGNMHDDVIIGDKVTVTIGADGTFDVVEAIVTSTANSGRTFTYANIGSNVSRTHGVFDGWSIADTSWFKRHSDFAVPFLEISPPDNSSTPSNATLRVAGSMDGTPLPGYKSAVYVDAEALMVTASENVQLTSLSTAAISSSGAMQFIGNPITIAGTGATSITGTTSVRIAESGGAVSLGSAWDSVRAPGIYNTTNVGAANVTVHSNNIMTRSTSSIKYKHDVVEVGEAKLADVVPKDRAGGKDHNSPFAILDVAVVAYRSDVEQEGSKNLSRLGFIAEDIAAKMPGVETLGPDGEVEAFDMNQIVSSILAVVQRQEKDIEKLKEQVKGPKK